MTEEQRAQESARLMGNKNCLLGHRPVKTCQRCGKEYQPTGNWQKYCAECALAAKVERCKAYDREYREANPEKEKTRHREYRAKIRPTDEQRATAKAQKSKEMSALIKEVWADPEYKLRLSAIQKEAQNRPEYKEQRSAAMKKTWADLEFKERQSALIKEALNRPEYKEQHSAAQKVVMADLEVRKQRSVAMKQIWADTDYKERHSGPLHSAWTGGRRVAHVRQDAKRRDLPLDPIFLNSWLPGHDLHHHRDLLHVIYVPAWLHRLIRHNHYTGKGMAEMDALALAYAGLSSDVMDDTLPFN